MLYIYLERRYEGARLYEFREWHEALAWLDMNAAGDPDVNFRVIQGTEVKVKAETVAIKYVRE